LEKNYVILLYFIYVEIKFQYGTNYFKFKFFVLNLGDCCSCAYDTQMDESKSSRPGFVHGEIGSKKA